MCDTLHTGGATMPTNLALDAALNEYVRRRKQLEILDHFGTIDFDPDYDYKKMRMLDRIEVDEE